MNYREVVNPDNAKTSPIPVPDKLGQLYTGEDFWPGAPWRVFPVIPEAAWLTHVNLRSANPPLQALYQMNYPIRPGNSTGIQIPGITTFVGDHSFGPFAIPCIGCLKKSSCKCDLDCICKDLCVNQKTDKCPCETHGCPIKYIPIN